MKSLFEGTSLMAFVWELTILWLYYLYIFFEKKNHFKLRKGTMSNDAHKRERMAEKEMLDFGNAGREREKKTFKSIKTKRRKYVKTTYDNLVIA